MCKLLEARGDYLERIRGSHHIYKLEGLPSISVPVHRNEDLKVGLQRFVMKQADISEDEL